MVNAIESVNITSVGNGASLVAGVAGNTATPILAIKSLIAGHGILIDADPRSSQVTITATGLPPLTSLVTAHVHWVAGGLAPNNLPIFTAVYPVLITAVIGRVEVPTVSVGSPAQLMLVKATNGVAISGGAPLTTTYFAANGTAVSNQVMTLVSDITVIRLDVGDSIGVHALGDWSHGSGGITVHMAPISS
jgi:hypothetical protein